MKKILLLWRYVPLWFKWLLVATITVPLIIKPYEYFFERSIVINVISVFVIPGILLILVPIYIEGGKISKQKELEEQQRLEAEQKEQDRLNGIW